MRGVAHIGALALAVLLLGGCGQQTSQAEYIGIDAAKVLALEAAGVQETAADFTTAGLDRRNGVDYYAVEFTAGGQSYEYDIDAVTGVIIDSKTTAPQTGGAVSNTNQGGQGTASLAVPDASEGQMSTGGPDSQVPVTASPTGDSGQGAQQIQPSGGDIGMEQAKQAALSHAGLSADQVTFVSCKLDWEDGRQVYDVEFYTADNKEYDYEIDAATGEIRSYDYDAEYYAPPAATGSISDADAKAIALAQVPGAAAGDIYEFEMDHDDGRLVYEGKIFYSGMEYEFEIDGYSGTLLSWEVEPIYH